MTRRRQYRVEIGASESVRGPGRCCHRSRLTRWQCRSSSARSTSAIQITPRRRLPAGSYGHRRAGAPPSPSGAQKLRRRLSDEHSGTIPAEGLTVEVHSQPGDEEERFAMYAFGAQFAEVQVDVDSGEIRVPRMCGIFAAGQIINPKTARSQFIGGMTMGLSMALHEQSVIDRRFGHYANHDFAEYHIAVNADIGEIEVGWIDEEDPHVNPMGSKVSAKSASWAPQRPSPTPPTMPPASASATSPLPWTNSSRLRLRARTTRSRGRSATRARRSPAVGRGRRSPLRRRARARSTWRPQAACTVPSGRRRSPLPFPPATAA